MICGIGGGLNNTYSSRVSSYTPNIYFISKLEIKYYQYSDYFGGKAQINELARGA